MKKNIEIKSPHIFNRALQILQDLYGENATFREGQYEAIENTLTRKRTLVVQKTGWGKSLIYFISTKILREQNKGTTWVISPLLALMDNQIEAAHKMGLKCQSIESRKENKNDIVQALVDNSLDLVLITPETLFSDAIQKHISKFNIGLLVIDEAHCISDWGHDFRLEYTKLKEIISKIPANVPILATTATANDRVIEDLQTQLGSSVFISRGSLTRESLYIQVLHLKTKAERYAWLLENMKKLLGTGVIYCLTKRDCEYLSTFLQQNGISACPYYSKPNDTEIDENLKKFQNNEIKVLVATIKLGMGYDKGDISFIIHFQMAKNIVSYYQQIGRAGRNIDKAYIFLMTGNEDTDILESFIKNAFPTQGEMQQILDILYRHNGLSKNKISLQINMKQQRLEKALTFLTKDGFIYKQDSRFYLTGKKFIYNQQHYDEITAIRKQELKQMLELTKTNKCYSQFIVNALDDFSAHPCGHCANCLGHELLPSKIPLALLSKTQEYINRQVMDIEPRYRNPDFTKIEHILQKGKCLSKYGDPGYGEMVKSDKYNKKKTIPRFRDELITRSAEVLQDLILQNHIHYITFVPSLRSDIVKDFAQRLAVACQLQFVDLIEKTQSNKPQKEMENSAFQYKNAFNSFQVKQGAEIPEKVLLVDDLVDSRWTLTACGFYLMKKGCKEVYPFALADTSTSEE